MVTKQQLQSMDPYEFEELVAELWKSKGYTTNVRKKSGDKAVDIDAERGGRKEVIQVKRYSDGNKIGSEEVRKYATLYQQTDANKVVLVTSGEFTNSARELADELGVEDISGDELVRELKNNNIQPTSSRSETTSTHQSTESNSSFSFSKFLVFLIIGLPAILYAYMLGILSVIMTILAPFIILGYGLGMLFGAFSLAEGLYAIGFFTIGPLIIAIFGIIASKIGKGLWNWSVRGKEFSTDTVLVEDDEYPINISWWVISKYDQILGLGDDENEGSDESHSSDEPVEVDESGSPESGESEESKYSDEFDIPDDSELSLREIREQKGEEHND